LYLLKNPIFCNTIFFTFQAQSLFKQAAVSLSFLPCNVSHSKQDATVFFPAGSVLPSSKGSDIFIERFLLNINMPLCFYQ